MKEKIEYFYGIKIEELHKNNDYYFFNLNNINYILREVYYEDNYLNEVYMLSYIVLNSYTIDRIIFNIFNKITSQIDEKRYILVSNQFNKKISLQTISNYSDIKGYNVNDFNLIIRSNWEKLWSLKIDYFERQIGENARKYPIIRESFDFFIGMAENAISYLVYTKEEETKTTYDKSVPSHVSLDNFYNPLSIILDHKARDVSEYIKISFFNDNKDIFKELDNYFYYNYYSAYGMRILFARILYPSFYFDLYDDIISGKKEEKSINTIISKIPLYINYLDSVHRYLSKFYNIPKPEWIKKEDINPH